MRTLNPVDRVNQLTRPYIEYQNSLEIFGRREKPVSLQIHFKVIEISFDFRGQQICLHQLQWLSART
jgi:hypothetical protein